MCDLNWSITCQGNSSAYFLRGSANVVAGFRKAGETTGAFVPGSSLGQRDFIRATCLLNASAIS